MPFPLLSIIVSQPTEISAVGSASGLGPEGPGFESRISDNRSMNHTTFVVYFDAPEPMGYPFDEYNYFLSYLGFSEHCARQGVDLYIVRGPESYLGQMRFRSGWKFDGERLLPVAEPIQADVVYVKGSTLHTEPTAVRVNAAELMDICADKLKTYGLFREYMAKTAPLPADHWQETIKNFPSDLLVLKPVTGMEGHGIQVISKEHFQYDQLDPHYAPYLVQEFIDCSTGMPGLVEGRHDLRLYIFNGVAKLAEYRRPKPNGYLANIAQGGSLTVLKMNQVPQWALDFVPNIDKHFQKFFPRIYTIDLMYAYGRPYLVELNSRPGLPFREWSYYDELHSYIFETLASAIAGTP